MKLYQVQVTGRPTFYLNADVQGIVNRSHAARIATEVTGETVLALDVMAFLDGDPLDEHIPDWDCWQCDCGECRALRRQANDDMAYMRQVTS